MLMIFDKSDGSLFEVLHKYVLLHSSSSLFFGASRQLKLNSIFRRMTSFSSFRQTYELRRSEAWEIALAVAKGMNHLHTHNPKIIHRDLKSHNLLVYKKDGKYDWSATKLCDFGLATVGARGAGTPCYMAPELHANKPYNEKVDVFAFGVLLCELVSLEVPFGGFTPFDIRSKVTKGERPPLSRTCPRPIEKLIKECWHDEPKRRPSFAQVMCRSRTSFFSCTSHLHSMTSRK